MKAILAVAPLTCAPKMIGGNKLPFYASNRLQNGCFPHIALRIVLEITDRSGLMVMSL